jgi:hypothetical protein
LAREKRKYQEKYKNNCSVPGVPYGMGVICHQMSYFKNIDHVSCTVFRGHVPLFHMLQGKSVGNSR